MGREAAMAFSCAWAEGERHVALGRLRRLRKVSCQRNMATTDGMPHNSIGRTPPKGYRQD